MMPCRYGAITDCRSSMSIEGKTTLADGYGSMNPAGTVAAETSKASTV